MKTIAQRITEIEKDPTHNVELMVIAKLLLNENEAFRKTLEAIIADNEGDFSNYTKEAFIDHLKSEAWFCKHALGVKIKERMEAVEAISIIDELQEECDRYNKIKGEISEKDNRSCFNKGSENEISEKDKALKELKMWLENPNLYGIDRGSDIWQIMECAQNLVNAIEAEKKSYLEATLTYGQAFSRVFIDQEGNFRKESIPFKEIYKEPEPKSLWKDVSELLYDSALSPEQIYIFEIFAEHFEQLQRDVEELKSKVR